MALLSPATLAIITVSALAAGVYKFIIYPALLSPLSKIPNAHFTSSISPLWILWNRFRMRGNRTIHEAHNKYGPIVRLAPGEISVNCVDGGIRTVYAGGFEKHDWYPRVFGAFGTISMFSMVGSRPHSVRKRMMSNIYSKSYLQGSPQLAAASRKILFQRLFPILERHVERADQVEIHELNNAITMDFITAYIFGLSAATNFLEDAQTRKQWLEAYQCRKPFEFYHQEVPNLVAWAETVKLPLIPSWCQKANNYMESWGLEICDNADKYLLTTVVESEPTVYKQLKMSMVKQLPSDGVKPLDEETSKKLKLEIACELYDQLTAGHETSAVALTYLYWELSKNPELQCELREELRGLSPSINIPANADIMPDLPSSKDIDSLPLLNAVVMETLRLHAPIPGIQPRVTPSPTCSLGGYDGIPPGTRVSAQAYSLHQNPNIFPEPESWLPRRWLKQNDVSEMESMRRWFWAFGSGGRMCVGSNFALQEMKLVVAAIYSNYTTSIVNDDGIEAIDAYTVRPTSNRLILKFGRA
ncbi:Cytochrome P450 family protein [Coccidioides posadasii C735 delta SOWgp]|uniref:Cytochrome P450 10 n=2 Tax=Coccidioides posadasii TaxID=199306 RepID=A0A0J6FM33_COCPO|nr:Cytochrome P450 family protein [Coccidioides posadasii C735 delta SOWgp]EER29230.1 Cytochrome P450 family protein [Coccidioides posadasii C735 delta SOWgp]KMM70490.1 cytochrome P450 10 [Coccidioides posadasii RMSCC 3488]|eukprot:XP_003071375.1 Cytochrome P450 family protein [Coccidioides posadasii C735 delta SOWgp]